MPSGAASREGSWFDWIRRYPWLWRLLAAWVVLAVAVLLRLRAVDMLPIDYDEDDYLRAGQQMATAIAFGDWGELTELNYRTEHPPLAKLAYAVPLVFLEPAEEIPDRPVSAEPAASLPQPHLNAARLTAASFGGLEVFVLALLNPLAGLFLGIHTFTIKYTSQVMLEALPALTSAVCVLAYSRSKGRRWAWLGVSAAALGLTAASKYVYVVAGLAVGLHWLWSAYPRGESFQLSRLVRWFTPVFVWGLLAVIVFFLANPYLWPAPVDRLLDSVLYHSRYAQSDQVQQANLPAWQPLVTLLQSVPWHPGVFVVMLDTLVTVLAVLGWSRLRQRHPVIAVWLVVGLIFLLLWPTKWPQYVLVLTVPLSLAAAEGVAGRVWEPLRDWVLQRRAGLQRRPARDKARATAGQQGRRALPWLIPGVVILLLIALFPLFYQVAMSLTDFSAISIRDGITGGVWREAWQGLTGQAERVEVTLDFRRLRQAPEVQYVGLGWFGQVLSPLLTNLLVFELIWTVLAVFFQVALGVGVALILHQRGVRFKGWWRTLFILPWAIPEFVGALVWTRIFHPSYGWLTHAVESHTVPFSALPVYENPQYALMALLLAATWFGWPIMLLAATAGLNAIAPDVYEAAAIDGAGRWQQFRQITWPLLLPLLVPVIIVRGIFAFNQFYLFYVMQAPAGLLTFSTLSFYIFNPIGQGGGLFAVSAALNIITVIVLVILLLFFNRWSQAAEGVTYA
jgi:ABC-type sugar transport system permease subunit